MDGRGIFLSDSLSENEAKVNCVMCCARMPYPCVVTVLVTASACVYEMLQKAWRLLHFHTVLACVLHYMAVCGQL